MPNPYHDAEGKFCSRNEMKTAIDKAASSGDFTTYTRLRDDLERADNSKLIPDTFVSTETPAQDEETEELDVITPELKHMMLTTGNPRTLSWVLQTQELTVDDLKKVAKNRRMNSIVFATLMGKATHLSLAEVPKIWETAMSTMNGPENLQKWKLTPPALHEGQVAEYYWNQLTQLRREREKGNPQPGKEEYVMAVIDSYEQNRRTLLQAEQTAHSRGIPSPYIDERIRNSDILLRLQEYSEKYREHVNSLPLVP